MQWARKLGAGSLAGLMVGALLAVVGSAPADAAAPPTLTGYVDTSSGEQPGLISVSPDGAHVWAVDTAAGSTKVMALEGSDTAPTWRSVANGGTNPWRIAYSSDSSRMYVTSTTDGTVNELDSTTGASIASIPVGSNPRGLAVGSVGGTDYAYVAVAGASRVAVVDLSTNTVVHTISVPFTPEAVAINRDGDQVYVGGSNGTVVRIYTYPNSVNNSVLVHGGSGFTVQDITVSPNGTVFVANDDNSNGQRSYGFIDAYDSSLGYLNTTDGATNYEERFTQIAVTPDGQTVYGADGGDTSSAAVYYYRVSDFFTPGTAVAQQGTAGGLRGDGPFGVAASPTEPRLYVTDRGQNSVGRGTVLSFLPGAPTAVTGVARNTRATISWAPAPNTGGYQTSYTVTASSGGSPVAGATCTATGATSCTITGLSNGTAYTFTVTATTSAGTGPASTPSAPVTPSTTAAPVDYTLSDFAGSRFAGQVNNGPATAADINNPQDTAVDVAGNVYITDSATGRVYKVNPATGQLVVFAGDGDPNAPAGSALAATLNFPVGIATGPDGSVYVVEAPGGSGDVQKITPNGQISNLAATHTSGSTTLQSPNGIAVDTAGNVYITDRYASSVVKVTPAGAWSVFAGGSGGTPTAGPATSSSLRYPSGVDVDAVGNVYIADSGNQAIEKVTPDGTLSILNQGTVQAPGSVAVDPITGTLFVGDIAYGQVFTLDQANANTLTRIAGTTQQGTPPIGAAPASTSLLGRVTGLSVAREGTVYTADYDNHLVEQLVPPTPGSPSAPVAVAGNASVSLTWSVPVHTGLSPITGYLVTPYLAGVAQTPQTITSTATNTTISGLSNGSVYTFTVAALNADGTGHPSALSNPVTPTAPSTGGGGGGVSRQAQAITIANPTSGISVGIDQHSVALNASSTSGLSLSYASSTPTVCTVTSTVTGDAAARSVITLISAGTCTVTASQAGNTTYNPASTTVSFAVTAAVADPAADLPLGALRLGGVDRVATSTTVSKAIFDDGKSQSLVIATSARFADSIAGARLAGLQHGPLLLTGTDALDASVASEVRRLVTTGGTVYVLGDTNALSATVQQGLQALSSDYTITRLGGADRFETAVKIADEVTASTGDTGPIYLVTGTNFADGATISALAARTGGVVLLTDGVSMPAATAAYLKAHDPAGTRTVPVGGDATTAARTAGLSVAVGKSIAGVDRYATAAAIAARFETTSGGSGSGSSVAGAGSSSGVVKTVGVATGLNWPDALTGAAAMSQLQGPLLLTQTATLPSSTEQALKQVQSSTTRGVVFGDTNAVDAATYTRIGGLIPTR